MTLILSNADVQSALNVAECLDVMTESYREQAASRAANRPTCHTYLQHSLPNATYSFKSVDGGVGKYGVLALRVTSDVVQEQVVHGSVRLEKLPLAGKGMFVGLVQLFSVETGINITVDDLKRKPMLPGYAHGHKPRLFCAGDVHVTAAQRSFGIKVRAMVNRMHGK